MLRWAQANSYYSRVTNIFDDKMIKPCCPYLLKFSIIAKSFGFLGIFSREKSCSPCFFLLRAGTMKILRGANPCPSLNRRWGGGWEDMPEYFYKKCRKPTLFSPCHSQPPPFNEWQSTHASHPPRWCAFSLSPWFFWDVGRGLLPHLIAKQNIFLVLYKPRGSEFS